MHSINTSEVAVNFIKAKINSFKPMVGMILGSGLNSLAEKIKNPISIPYQAIPGFSECGVEGHSGALLLGNIGHVPIACLQGRSHYYEGKNHCELQIPIRTLKRLGCETLILTNAAASLREEVKPGQLVLIEDHINFQGQNPLIGSNDEAFGPRFPSLQNAYDPELLALAKKMAASLDIPLMTGVYLATLGPCYETPAEIRAFKSLGADLVGMSTVPEVILARHCGLKVLAISTVTNMACGMSEEFLNHEGVLKVAKMAAQDLSELLEKIIAAF